MGQILDLKEAEKRAFRLANFEDGIMDIYLGTTFLFLSFYEVTRKSLGPELNIVLVLGLILLMAGFVWQAKKRLTLPRVGLVKFSHRTKKKIKTAHIITVTLVILTFLTLVLISQQVFTEPNWRFLPQWVSDLDVDMVFALVIIATFSTIAYALSVPRFYIYGVLLGLGNFFSTVLTVYQDQSFHWPVALAGLLIIITGVVILNNFIHIYPLPGEVNHG